MHVVRQAQGDEVQHLVECAHRHPHVDPANGLAQDEHAGGRGHLIESQGTYSVSQGGPQGTLFNFILYHCLKKLVSQMLGLKRQQVLIAAPDANLPIHVSNRVGDNAAMTRTLFSMSGALLALDSPLRTPRRQRCTAGSPRTRRCCTQAPSSPARSRSNYRERWHQMRRQHETSSNVNRQETEKKSAAGGRPQSLSGVPTCVMSEGATPFAKHVRTETPMLHVEVCRA